MSDRPRIITGPVESPPPRRLRTSDPDVVNAFEHDVTAYEASAAPEAAGICPPGYKVILDAEMDPFAFVKADQADLVALLLNWAMDHYPFLGPDDEMAPSRMAWCLMGIRVGTCESFAWVPHRSEDPATPNDPVSLFTPARRDELLAWSREVIAARGGRAASLVLDEPEAIFNRRPQEHK